MKRLLLIMALLVGCQPNIVDIAKGETVTFSVVAIGNSWTDLDGAPGTRRWVTRLESNLRQKDSTARVINHGHSGFTSQQVAQLTDWEDDIRTLQPDVVSIEVGINDYRKGLKPALTRMYVDNIVSRVLAASPKSRVKVWLPPRTTRLKITPLASWNTYRDTLKAVASEWDVSPGVDVKTFNANVAMPDLTSDIITKAQNTVWNTDMIHPDGNGHDKLGDAITGRMGI